MLIELCDADNYIQQKNKTKQQTAPLTINGLPTYSYQKIN